MGETVRLETASRLSILAIAAAPRVQEGNSHSGFEKPDERDGPSARSLRDFSRQGDRMDVPTDNECPMADQFTETTREMMRQLIDKAQQGDEFARNFLSRPFREVVRLIVEAQLEAHLDRLRDTEPAKKPDSVPQIPH